MSGEFAGGMILLWQLLLLGGVRCWAELRFVARFCGREAGPTSPARYLVANRLLAVAFAWLQAPLCGSLLLTALLCLFSVRALRLPPVNTALACTAVFMLNTFFDGFLEVAIGPVAASVSLPGLAASTAVQLLVPLLLVGALLAGYEVVSWRYPMKVEPARSACLCTLLPCMLIVWAVRLATESAAVVQLVWMLVSVVAFLSILAVNHSTVELANTLEETRQIEREHRVQQKGVREADRRWDEARSYQHDVRNHLLVVSGLLRRGLHRDAAAYLQTLVESADRLTPEVSTGSAALDVLLEEKLRYARQEGLSISVDLQARPFKELDETDLCVIFANGLDNAIHAAGSGPLEKKRINVEVKRRHDLLLIQMKNGVDPHSPPVSWGTGLRNIWKTAHKYGGSMQAEKQGDLFCLTVLLCRPKGGRAASGRDAAGLRSGPRP